MGTPLTATPIGSPLRGFSKVPFDMPLLDTLSTHVGPLREMVAILGMRNVKSLYRGVYGFSKIDSGTIGAPLHPLHDPQEQQPDAKPQPHPHPQSLRRLRDGEEGEFCTAQEELPQP